MQVIKEKNRKNIRKHRILFFSLPVILLIVLGGILLFWQLNKKWIIRKKLESVINEKGNGLYKINYDKLDLDEVSGFLSITNMRIEYDSIVYSDFKQKGNTPYILVKINIPKINIYGVKTSRAMINNEVIGQKMEIVNPFIELIYTMEGKDSSRNVPTTEIYEQILGNLNQISIDTITISGASLETKRMKEKNKLVDFSDLYIQLTDVRIDSTADADASRLLFSKKIILQCDHFGWVSKDKLYRYKAENIFLNSESKSAFVSGFFLSPQLAEDAFVKKLPFQNDRFDFSIQKIEIKNIDFYKLFDESVSADNIIIGRASFKVYRDIIIPRDHKNRVGLYPQQVFAKIPIPIAINKLTLHNSFVEYKERNTITRRSGRVQFYNTSAVITNLANKIKPGKNNIMTADIRSDFLNKAPMRTLWTFDMNNSKGNFGVKGNVGSINSEDLNLLAEPMGPAKIKSGQVNSLHFDLTGNDYSMNGTIKLLYGNFKVALLEKENESGKMDKKDFTSFIANVLIKNSNPSGKNEPRSVYIQNARDVNRSIFDLVWKTLFKGIRETVGIKKQ